MDHTTAIGTASGTLLTIITTIPSGDFLRTVVLATIGALVSFTASILFKFIHLKIKNHINKKAEKNILK